MNIKVVQIRVRPKCRICETETAGEGGVCKTCYWIRYGMAEYYAKKRAEHFAAALLICGLALFWIAFMAYAIWKLL